MKNNTETAFLQFDFKQRNGAEQAPLLFSHPVKVITTDQLTHISDCMEQIDDAIDQGYYVAGYFSYETLYAFMEETNPNQINNCMPLLWFGVFEEPTEKSVSEPESFSVGDWQMQITKQEYEDNFSKVMQAIKNEQTEQINYTVPFQADFKGSAFHYYQQLKNAQRSNYCAYINIDEYHILSASPELFFHVKDGDITVRPMKGTAKRGRTSEEDIVQKTSLKYSEKNQLENRLITDLMKAELKKVVDDSTIKIIDRYRVEKYPTVYQMTSGVTGRLQAHFTMMDIVKALYPCGSISGVPKTASLELIREIENRSREVYCGAIGYITPEKEAVFNVPIRTVWIDESKQQAFYGAGGAITEQSKMQEEYEEVVTKTDVLTWKQPNFELLETIALHNGEMFLLKEHLHRLQQSGDYFNIPVNQTTVQQKLIALQSKYPLGNWRVRLTLSQTGEENITIAPLEEINKFQVVLAKQPIDKAILYHYHKTTYRNFYEKHQQTGSEILDTLLWNADEELTEFTIGNVVVELHGELFTPPVSCGLLPGTFREKLLQDGRIKEKTIKKTDLPNCTQIWLINSVRQWMKVELIQTSDN